MSTKLFKSACEALWGPQYRSPAARELGIHLRSLMRYDAGERPVPAVLMERLGKLLTKHEEHIAKIKPAVIAAGTAKEAA